MLKRLRAFLGARPAAGLDEIAAHLGVAPDAARGMCEAWIARGQVERIARATACRGCCQCAPETLELYRWRGPVMQGDRGP